MAGKRVITRSHFHDLIELPSASHPVGRQNLITSDFAWLNCLLSLAAATTLVFGLQVSIDLGVSSTTLLCLALVMYCLQILEFVVLSQTIKTLFSKQSWLDFESFKIWFYELKRSRPVLTFEYKPLTLNEQ